MELVWAVSMASAVPQEPAPITANVSDVIGLELC